MEVLRGVVVVELSVQQRASGKNRRGYAQLSYTFQKRSRTDYVQPEDVERIKSEMANYRKFKELGERLVALSIEESKRKTEQRRSPQCAASHRPAAAQDSPHPSGSGVR